MRLLRGVYPELREILRCAQNDRGRRARNDVETSIRDSEQVSPIYLNELTFFDSLFLCLIGREVPQSLWAVPHTRCRLLTRARGIMSGLVAGLGTAIGDR